MKPEQIYSVCPCCSAIFAASLPLDSRRSIFDSFEPSRAVTCPYCRWEFAIDIEGHHCDDGEVEPEAELEIDDEGELIDACDMEPFPPWHASASAARQRAGLRMWNEFRAWAAH